MTRQNVDRYSFIEVIEALQFYVFSVVLHFYDRKYISYCFSCVENFTIEYVSHKLDVNL